MKISGVDDERTKLLAVEKFFAGKFTYSTWQGTDKLPPTNTTPLTRFLLTSRSGHCEYFATATVLLLRELEFPRVTPSVTPFTKRAAAAMSCANATRTPGASRGTAREKFGRISTPRRRPGSRLKANARRPWNGFRISARGSVFKLRNSAGGRRICANTFSGR